MFTRISPSTMTARTKTASGERVTRFGPQWLDNVGTQVMHRRCTREQRFRTGMTHYMTFVYRMPVAAYIKLYNASPSFGGVPAVIDGNPVGAMYVLRKFRLVRGTWYAYYVSTWMGHPQERETRRRPGNEPVNLHSVLSAMRHNGNVVHLPCEVRDAVMTKETCS